MASPRHIPAAAAAGSGNKENISENGATPLDRPALRKELSFSAKGKKNPTGFNLRKSIAWNPAFFTEEGVLDNSELSVLTGSELMANAISVKTEHMHRVSGLLPKSKIDSGPSMETGVVPAAAAIHKEISGSVKFENPEINPSSFRGTASTIAKPSALRMPSPSVGFFNQEKAQMSHGNAIERNVGRFSAGNQMPPSSSPGDEKPALDDRNSVFVDSLHDEGKFALPEEPNTDVGTELETLKASAVTEYPLLHMECERNHSFKRCSPVKLEGNDLICQGMTDSGSIGAKDLENPYVGERKLPVSLSEDQIPLSSSSSHEKPALDDKKSILNDSLYDEGKCDLSEEPDTDGGTELETKKKPAAVTEDPLLHVGKEKGADRPRTNTILRDHLKNLVPFTEEWLAAMEACGQEVLEQKSGAVQNSPPDKTGPEPSPWSPVTRLAGTPAAAISWSSMLKQGDLFGPARSPGWSWPRSCTPSSASCTVHPGVGLIAMSLFRRVQCLRITMSSSAAAAAPQSAVSGMEDDLLPAQPLEDGLEEPDPGLAWWVQLRHDLNPNGKWEVPDDGRRGGRSSSPNT
ncbi:hypothetical protein PR202_gb00779 [Eleusine coracana subsp. coracana]|uniref:Uncharacterized protein n=1 Tax=Eleusine coracana subsp. coracana TaxID=191504 RepID=A0AAV5DSR1_ELECO|nr:hypothetical protein PR202_gb00779 [Eleusine coracana subsp. coracana]